MKAAKQVDASKKREKAYSDTASRPAPQEGFAKSGPVRPVVDATDPKSDQQVRKTREAEAEARKRARK
jgi:hypothetical protein